MDVHRRRLCPLHRLLAFTSLIGTVNILLLYNNMGEPLETYTGQPENVVKFHRQISSVVNHVDADTSKPKQNVLEQLNLVLKDTVEKYESAGDIAPRYENSSQNPSGDSENFSMYKDDEQGSRCHRRLFLLILVHSSPKNFIDRQSIRLSWGKEENPINQGSWTRSENSWKTVFVIGKSPNSKLDRLVQNEAQEYGDIILGNFLDSYRNLSLKMLTGLKWANTSCPSKYILKTDDDCYVNTYSLIEWLRDYHTNRGWRNLYVGRVQKGMGVVRDKTKRHFVSQEDHASPTFDPYISGGGYVFTASLVPRILEVARTMTPISVDDALFGGFMRRIGVKATHSTRFLPFIYCQRPSKGFFDARVSICYFQKALVLHGVRDIEHIRMHYNVLLVNFIPTMCDRNVGDIILKNRERGRCF